MLYSEQMKQICEKLGVNPDECKDGLYSTLLQTICDACDGGGGGGGGTGGGGGGDNFPIGDGNTHIWISLAEGRTSPKLGVGVQGTVTVDWGDGSEPDTLTGTSTTTVKYTPVHEYGKAGEYVITLLVTGNIEFKGDSTRVYLFACDAGSKDNRSSSYVRAVKKIEIGNNVWFGIYAFASCYGLSSVIIHGDVPQIGSNAFASCHGLSSVIIRGDVPKIGNNAFASCYGLSSVIIPNSVTSIGSNAFASCHGLSSVIIHGGVTSFESSAFSGCSSLGLIDFSQYVTVPAIPTANMFSSVPTDCIFKIPASLYDEWIAATNWSAVANTYTFVGV